jgi:hypothetical protein
LLAILAMDSAAGTVQVMVSPDPLLLGEMAIICLCVGFQVKLLMTY